MKADKSLVLLAAALAMGGCWGSGNSHDPAVASRVIFSSNRDLEKGTKGPQQLYTMKLDGTDLQLVKYIENGASEPAACDDGSKIAFTSPSNRDDLVRTDQDLFVMDRDGTNIKNITGFVKGNDTSPCYCGDGTEIVFASNRSGSSQIWKIAPDGSKAVQLTGPAVEADATVADRDMSYAPDISHNNDKIVYAHGPESDIWIMNADGSNKIDLKQRGTTPRFNEATSLIVFARDGDIYTMHLDGTVVKKLTNLSGRGEVDFQDPAFSPDGRKIVFTGTNGATEIYIMDSTGEGLKKLTNLGVDSMHPNFIRVIP